MARPGAARKARIAKALKTKRLEPNPPAPTVDQDPVAKKPRGRPRKLQRDPYQSVNELCVQDGDGYADGTHTHRTHSHVVRWFFVCCRSPRLREEGQEDQAKPADR